MWSYRWTSCFPEKWGKTHCLTVSFLIFFFWNAHLRLCESVLALAHVWMLFYERWSNDKMSCDQWAVDRTLQSEWKESPWTDPVRFWPPGQGHCSTKCTLSLSATPKGPLHGPCSPQQHQATESISSLYLFTFKRYWLSNVSLSHIAWLDFSVLSEDHI